MPLKQDIVMIAKVTKLKILKCASYETFLNCRHQRKFSENALCFAADLSKKSQLTLDRIHNGRVSTKRMNLRLFPLF